MSNLIQPQEGIVFDHKILPALSDMKSFEKFLESPLDMGILMGFHVAQLGPLTAKMRDAGKQTLIHLDLIKGLSGDEYGTEFLCQTLPIAGVISHHQNVVSVAKKKKKLAILRMFLIDSLSLGKSLEIAKKIEPDYIEMLPALAFGAVDRIKRECNIPLIGGGLIESKEEIDQCFQAGMVAVTTSRQSLWMYQ